MTNQTEQGAAGFSLLPVDDMESWPQGGRWTTAIVLRLLEEYAIANMMADRHQRASNPGRPTPEGYTSDGWISVAQGLPEPQMPVLLDIGGKYPIRAMWVAAKTLPVGGGDDDDFGEYVEEDDEWYCPEGWYEWNQYENRHWSVGAKARRWMPLPTTTGSKP